MKKLIVLVVAFMSLCVSNAQVRFTATISGISSGCNSSGDNLTNAIFVGVMEGLVESYNSRTFPDCKTCERARQSLTGSASHGGCTVRLATTPCTPCGGTSGSVNILGPSQGYSFYSSNPAKEVSDWSNNDIERQLALNSNYQTNHPDAIITNDDSYNKERAVARENSGWYLDADKPFVSVNMREEGFSRIESENYSMQKKFDQATDFSFLANSANVQRYVNASTSLAASYIANPQDLTQLLHNQFRIVSGFDLDAIMQKLPSERTDAEKQALIDYREFRRIVTDNMIVEINDIIAHKDEVKDFEMAVLAENCYKDSGHTFLSRTNYKEVSTNFFADDTPMRNLSALIDECNSTNSETGFHAEIYYNEKTNEYTIAFEGTNSDEILNDIIKNDVNLGLGGIPSQYRLAYRIAEFINTSNFPSDIKLNFTGHSLGGGLASIVGLATGKPTYTYNAAGVNKNIINEFELSEKSDTNIKAFQTAGDQFNSDPLTSAQEGDLKAPVAGMVIGTISSIPIVGTVAAGKLTSDVLTGYAAAPAIGNKEKVWSYSGHSIVPMVSYLAYPVAKYESMKNYLSEKGHGVERQTQESILIITE